MTFQESHAIIQDYFLDHIHLMTHRQCAAFMISLLSLPLVPEFYHNHIDGILHSLLPELARADNEN